MKFSIPTIIALMGLASAAPKPQRPSYPPQSSPPANPNQNPNSHKPFCLTPTTATTLTTNFALLLTSYTDTLATTLLSPSFIDTSDSINTLAGYPLNSTTFPSLSAFKAGQGTQRPIGFEVLSIDAVTCDSVAFRWSATPNPLGRPEVRVKGVNTFVAVRNDGNGDGNGNGNGNRNGTEGVGIDEWQIGRMYSEFNSCVWVQAVGGKCGFA